MKITVKFHDERPAAKAKWETAYGVISGLLGEAATDTVVYDLPDKTGFEIGVDAMGSAEKDIPEDVREYIDYAFAALEDKFGIEMKIAAVAAV